MGNYATREELKQLISLINAVTPFLRCLKKNQCVKYAMPLWRLLDYISSYGKGVIPESIEKIFDDARKEVYKKRKNESKQDFLHRIKALIELLRDGEFERGCCRPADLFGNFLDSVVKRSKDKRLELKPKRSR